MRRLNVPTLKSDIEVFCDPATEFVFREASNKLSVALVKRGQEREYFFDLNTGQVENRKTKTLFNSFKALLASDDFSAIRSFSATQNRILASKFRDRHDWIPPSGVFRREQDNSTSHNLTDKDSMELFAVSEGDREVKILLIDGSAGVGKTSFIERAVYERTLSPSLPPILHVTSQGRRLSNLPDTIGKTANYLNALFRYEEVPVLVRHGVLQVAIDGFDELVHPDGYGNAWSALNDFIRQVGSGGPIILAGRDTFFDQNDIKEKLEKLGSKVSISTIRLEDVSVQTAIKWITDRGWVIEKADGEDAKEFFSRSYTRRPFFLQQIVVASEAKSFRDLASSIGSPLQILVDKIIAREAKLLGKSLSGAAITPQNLAAITVKLEAALHQFFEEMATDMAEREVELISREYLEFTCEALLEPFLPPDSVSAIKQRAASFALLERSEKQGELRFPHTDFQHHFLASAVLNSLAENKMPLFIRANLLQADVLEAFVERLERAPAIVRANVANCLTRLLSEERYAIYLQSNVAALLAACHCGEFEKKAKSIIKNITIHELYFADVVNRLEFSQIICGRVKLSDADVKDVTFLDFSASTLVMNDNTRFGDTLPKVGFLIYEEKGRQREVRKPAEIADILRSHQQVSGQPTQRVETEYFHLFERLCRRFLRQHTIRDNEQDPGSALLHMPGAEKLIPVLLETNALWRQERSAAGSMDAYYKMPNPGQYLDSSKLNDRAASVVDRVRSII